MRHNNADEYLRNTGRQEVATFAKKNIINLRADDEVYATPEKYYDQVLDIDLNEVEPHLNGPFTPDAATPISQMKVKGPANDYPMDVEVALIGSCTNSSYQDLARAASVARQAYSKNIPVKAQLIINPGSEQIRYTAERDGILDDLKKIGAVIMTNACGPCIGQWKRHTDDNNRKNAIVTSFNRNFRRRADGNPNTFAFIAGPELTTALAISGRLDFNPATDMVYDRDGNSVKLDEPTGYIFPPKGFAVVDNGFISPSESNSDVDIIISKTSDRLQKLEPFAAWNGKDYEDMPLLIKHSDELATIFSAVPCGVKDILSHSYTQNETTTEQIAKKFGGVHNSCKVHGTMNVCKTWVGLTHSFLLLKNSILTKKTKPQLLNVTWNSSIPTLT